MSAVTRRLTVMVLAMLGAVAGGLVFGGAPALAGIPYAYRYLAQLTGANIPAGAPVSGPFEKPFGVAVAPSGDVYVSDTGKDVVDEFNSSGEYVAQLTGANIPVSAPQSGPFGVVRGVAVDASGDVYVSDAGKGVVDEFNPAGEYVAQIGSGILRPLREGQYEDDRSLAVDDATGNIYVASSSGGRVYVFNSSGAFLEAWNGFAFRGPLGYGGGSINVAADNSTSSSDQAAGDVYVEIFNEQVLLSTPSGNPVGLPTPTGYGLIPAVDPSGDLFKTGGGTVSEFTSRAALAQQLTGADIPAGAPVSGPFGDVNAVAFDAGSDLYAVDISKGVVDELKPFPLAGVTTGALATGVTGTSAVVPGTVNPAGLAASSHFEYGPGTAYGSRAPAIVLGSSPPTSEDGSGSSPVAVSAALTGLEPNKTYHYRLDGLNANGTNVGDDETFTTATVPPAVDGQSASAVTETSAILNARINPENDASGYRFEYGASAAYGSSAPLSVNAGVGSGYGDVNVGQQIAGLQPGVTYHYRVLAENAAGEVIRGVDQVFTTLTPAAAPLVSTGAASEVAQSSATISGTVNPEGSQTGYGFQIGTDTSYGAEVFGEVGAGATPVLVALSAQSLQPGTTYHYRLVAYNPSGTSYGADESFTTGTFPSSTLTAPLTPVLVPTPPFTPPAVSAAGGSKAGKATKKTRKRKAKKRARGRGGKADSIGKARGKGRGKR